MTGTEDAEMLQTVPLAPHITTSALALPDMRQVDGQAVPGLGPQQPGGHPPELLIQLAIGRISSSATQTTWRCARTIAAIVT